MEDGVGTGSRAPLRGRHLGRVVRRLLLGVVGLPLLLLLVLVVEAALATRGDRLPGPPLALDGRVGGPGRALRVVWLGDSTAAGVGASGPDAALPRLVAEGLGRPVALTVLAVSGDRVSDVVDDQLASVGEADVVFVSIGSNDVTHLTTRDDLRARYREVLAGLPEAAEVVLLGVPDFGGVPRLAQPLRAVAALRGRQLDGVVRDVAEDAGAAYVGIAGETGPAFRRDPGRLFAADRYHPSDEGYRLWAAAVLDVVRAARIAM